MNKRTLGAERPGGLGDRARLHGDVGLLRIDRRARNRSRTIQRALELGCNFLDTSDMYGPHTNEELVGRAIEGRRDEVVPGDQVRHQASTGRRRRDARSTVSPTYVRRAVRRLARGAWAVKTDHIDLYYQHRVDPNTPIEETVGAMAELVAGGQGPLPRPLRGERRDDPPRARGAPDHRGADRVLAVDARRRGGDPADAERARDRPRRLLAARARVPLRALHLARGARRGRLPPLRPALHGREPPARTCKLAERVKELAPEKGDHAGPARARVGAAAAASTSCRSRAPSASATWKRTSPRPTSS